MDKTDIEKDMDFADWRNNRIQQDAYKKAFDSLTPIEKEKHLLEMEFLKLQAKELKNKHKERRKDYLRLIGATILGGLIGLTPMLKQKDTILNPTILPKIQIVRDTVYVKTIT